MYVTQRPNDVLAVDAKTGRVFWLYRYTPSPDARVCCGSNNRGVAILGDTLFMGTLDAHLVAIDAKNGRPLWNVARCRREARVLDHPGAARREGQGDCRRRRRRVRHPRVHRRVRRADRQGSVALLHDSRARRAGPRHLEGRRVEERRRRRCGSPAPTIPTSISPTGASGIPGPDWNPDQRPGDNLYTRFGRRARRGYRRAQVAFSVHAERRLRLRLGAGPGARRHELAGRAGEADAVGESQRLLLRPRSRHGPSSCRATRSSR